MMPVEKAIEVARTLERPKNPGKASPMGPPRENVFTHEFVGGNFTVPRMLGAEAHSEIAVRRLQSAAELELRLPEKAAAGNIARLTVRVHNVGAGHNLPTSLTEVRQMWLEVTVTGADGGVVYCSGALDENHDLTEGTVLFHAEAVDARSERTMKLWEIERFTYNSTIPAKGFADREFAFFVPAATPGPLQVGVRLRYRSFPQELARELLGAETPLLPIVDMATRSGVVRVE